MENLNFENGYKEYSINGDESKVIRFRPTDFAINNRVDKAIKEIEKISRKYSQINDRDAFDSIIKCDEEVKEQINYIFGSDVCSIVFEGANCMSISKGVPLYQHFINAVVPLIKKEVSEEQKKSDNIIKKYTSQVK